MTYARIVNNTAVDVRTESPEGCFTPEVVAEFVTVPDEVENGWVLAGGVWSAPVVPDPVPVDPPVVLLPSLTPPEFKQCFTIQEEIAINTAATTDAVISTAFKRLDDPRLTVVDLNLSSVQGLIDYLTSLDLITVERASEIKSGKML